MPEDFFSEPGDASLTVSPDLAAHASEQPEESEIDSADRELVPSDDIFDGAPYGWSMQEIWEDGQRYVFYGYRYEKVGCKIDSSFFGDGCDGSRTIRLHEKTERYYERCFVKVDLLGNRPGSKRVRARAL